MEKCWNKRVFVAACPVSFVNLGARMVCVCVCLFGCVVDVCVNATFACVCVCCMLIVV
jgi:hypothetical protein